MEIFIDLNGKIITLETTSSDTIEDIRAKLKKKGISADVLIFNGQHLEHHRSLSDYNIQNKSTIRVICRTVCSF